MATITIKDIPDELYEKLEETAKLHRRSIDSEIIQCIENAIVRRRMSADEMLAEARRIRALTDGIPILDEEFYAAKNEGRPYLSL